jgi:hypothetical protein
MALMTKSKETTHYRYKMTIFVLGDMKRRALYHTFKSWHILQNLHILASNLTVNPEDGVSIYFQNISSTAPCPQTVA